MRELLLYLYSASTTIHFFAFAALPVSVYWFTSNQSSKTIGVTGLSLLTFLFGVMCFIPTVIPENHTYVIFPNVLYAGICAVALIFRLTPFAKAYSLKQSQGKQVGDHKPDHASI